MMIGNNRILLLDEITTGLDAAMAFDILKLFQQWTRITGGSVVAALLQPTPEVYELFDNIILLREGASIYSGPRSSVLPYLASLGIEAPDDQDDADFLIDFLTDPPLYFAKRQQRELKKLRLKKEDGATRKLKVNSNGNGNGYLYTNDVKGHSPNATTQSLRESSVVMIHLEDDAVNGSIAEKTEINYQSNGKANGSQFVAALKTALLIDANTEAKQNSSALRSPSNAPVTTSALKAAFQKSKHYSAINDTIAADESSSAVEKFTRDAQSKSAYTAAQFAQTYSHSQLYHGVVNIKRQLTFMKRNNLMIFPRIFSAIFMGVCISTLYIQLSPSKSNERIGLILFGLIFLAFSNMAELPISEELKDAVGKQLDAGFYPAFTHVLAVSLPMIPLAAIEATIFGSLLYWVSGFVPDAGRYFVFLLLLMCTNIVLGTIFRAVSYVTPNQVIAQQMGGPITVLTFLFGGFLVTEEKIPNFLIEFFWWSPFSWTLRAAANNEFNAGRYSQLTPSGVREGDSYLNFWEIRTDNEYKWAAVGYCIGLIIVFSIVCTLAVKYIRYDVSMGTKRPPDEEEVRAKLSLAAVQLSIRQESERNLNGEIAKEGANINAQSVLPFIPTTLTWNNVHYTIPVHGKDRKLLKEVSGFAEPGVLTALMGASGAGKTTLMDVLAGRKTLGTLEGDINVNGQPFQSVNYRRILGYVEQNDLHMPLDTVRQALLFSAKLRLPASITDDQREQFVNEIIELLELTPIADRIIGNEAIPGIAGWQKKLVTIGVELVANPSIICLDEPTSGLDSRAAIVVMRVIRKIASTGRAVLCTIHQPSAEVFYMFDRLFLLKSGGETVYFGPIGEVNAENLVEYLEESSNKKIPPKMNPASWMLDVIGAGTTKTDIDYAKLYKQHSIKTSADRQLKDIEASFQSGKAQVSSYDNAIYAASFLQQYLAVQYRAFTSYYRNVPFNLTRIILINLLGVIFGLVYLDTRNVGTNFAAMQSKLASVYMTIGFAGAIQCMIVVPVLIRDRSAYYRERSSSMYSSLVYSLATFIVEVPYVFIATIMFNYSYYFMVNLDDDGNLFWKFIFASFLNAITFTSVGHLMAAAFPNFVVASQVQGILMTFFFLFGGTFIPVSSMPKGWLWMYYIDPLPKAIIAAVFPQFRCEGDFNVCPYIVTNDGAKVTYSDFVSNGFEAGHGDYWKWIGYLILTIVVFRIIIAMCLRYISHIRR